MRRSRILDLGDRRSRRRYPVVLAIRWRRLLGKNALESGTGMTVDLSSQGMLFEADRKILPGGGIEASIAWPVLLRNVRLQLVIAGEVVRTAKGRVAVRIRHHEFRTVSARRSGGPVGGWAWSAHNDAVRALTETAVSR